MIKLRAHHLLCIPRFYRGGYDTKFAKNMKKICIKIRKNPNKKIKVIVAELDDLCNGCPNAYKKKCIQSATIGKWVIKQDKKVLKHLKLKKDSVHKSKDIFNLSIQKVNSQTINSLCGGCIFLKNCLKVGINKSFQKDLNSK